MTLYSWLANTTTNISLNCKVPENIHTPPPPTEGNGNSGSGVVQGQRNFWREGGGVVSMNFFFFQTGLNFHTVVPKVVCILLLELRMQKIKSS